MNSVKSIFGVLLLLVGGFLLVRLVPIYWVNYKLGQLVDEQSLQLTYTKDSEEQIAAKICEQAHQFDLDLAPQQVTVKRTSADLSISVDYTATVDLLVTAYDLKMHAGSRNHNVNVIN